MISTYSYFKVNILKKKFYSELGNKYKKTAEIILFDKHDNELFRLEKGCIDTADIYDLILNGKELILDDCYVKKFSL